MFTFVLRADRLLSERGQLGYVTVNTVIEGATLRVGLGASGQAGSHDPRWALPTPVADEGANLEIGGLWASRLPLSSRSTYWLDGEEVPAIGDDLQAYGRIKGRPYRLRVNDDIAFTGTTVLGLGFTLTEARRNELISLDQRNTEVIQPYVIGRDLNQRPDCSGSRWIINFSGLSLEQAEEYSACIERVRRLVKPERDQQ